MEVPEKDKKNTTKPGDKPEVKPNIPPAEKPPEEKPNEEVPEPPKPAKEDPLLHALMKDLGEEAPEIKPVDEKPNEEKPVEKPPEEKPTEKPNEQKPVAKKAKKGVIPADVVPPVVPPPPPAPAKPEPAAKPEPKPEHKPAADPDAEYIAGLTDEQKEELAEAEMAERMFPEKYKGRKAKLVQWYRKFDTDVQKIIEENDEKKLDEIPEFKKLVDTKPRLEVADFKKVQRKMGEESAVQRTREELQPKLSEIERKQKEMEFQPTLQRAEKSFDDGIGQLIAQDENSPMKEIQKLYAEKGGAEVAKEFPLETKIFTEERESHTKMAKEYLLFTQNLRSFDQNNPVHNNLIGFINDQTNAMLKAGEKNPALLMNEGRRFISRADYLRLQQTNPAELDKYWTFTHNDVLEMLAVSAKDKIERRIRDEDAKLRSLGYERKKPAAKPAEAAPKEEPKPIAPPKASPTPQRGGGISPKPAPAGGSAPVGEPIDVVSSLRLKD